MEANRVIEGAIAKSGGVGIKISIAVCDAGGRLVAFQRMKVARRPVEFRFALPGLCANIDRPGSADVLHLPATGVH
jgi:hypothetical protein